jgi:hypothetical protein
MLLHGIWKRVLGDEVIPYVVYDSVTSIFSEKRDYGFNFRSELRSRARVESHRILWGVGDGTYDPWYWLQWSPNYDTLILSYDSLFWSRSSFIKDTVVADVNPWIENISPAQIAFYPPIDTWIKALAYSDSFYYVLTNSGWNDGMIRKVRLGDTTVVNYSFPSAQAMDVSGGVLWVAGDFYLEKRNLNDTTLLARYDLSRYFADNGGNNWIQGITASEDRIFLAGSFNKSFVFSIDGTLLSQDSTYAGLGDMMFYGGRLWGVTTGSTIHEIDPATMRSKHTYYLAGNVLSCRFQGIAYHDGKIACADFIQNIMSVWEVAMP